MKQRREREKGISNKQIRAAQPFVQVADEEDMLVGNFMIQHAAYNHSSITYPLFGEVNCQLYLDVINFFEDHIPLQFHDKSNAKLH